MATVKATVKAITMVTVVVAIDSTIADAEFAISVLFSYQEIPFSKKLFLIPP